MPKPRHSKNLAQTMISVLGITVVTYFLYHTLQGERGLSALLHMEREVKIAEEELARLKKEKNALEHRTYLMRPESLDPDLLEEKSRELLNYSKPNEIIVLTPQGKNTPTK